MSPLPFLPLLTGIQVRLVARRRLWRTGLSQAAAIKGLSGRCLAMLRQRMALPMKVLAFLFLAAGLGACRKAPEANAEGIAASPPPGLSLERTGGDIAPAKNAKEATKRAVEFARSASAAAKNAAAAAERAAAAADAAVDAIQKIPQDASPAAPATPKPGK